MPSRIMQNRGGGNKRSAYFRLFPLILLFHLYFRSLPQNVLISANFRAFNTCFVKLLQIWRNIWDCHTKLSIFCSKRSCFFASFADQKYMVFWQDAGHPTGEAVRLREEECRGHSGEHRRTRSNGKCFFCWRNTKNVIWSKHSKSQISAVRLVRPARSPHSSRATKPCFRLSRWSQGFSFWRWIWNPGCEK